MSTIFTRETCISEQVLFIDLEFGAKSKIYLQELIDGASQKQLIPYFVLKSMLLNFYFYYKLLNLVWG